MMAVDKPCDPIDDPFFDESAEVLSPIELSQTVPSVGTFEVPDLGSGPLNRHEMNAASGMDMWRVGDDN